MREAVTSALQALEDHAWLDPSQRYYAHLCLEEAVVNAITHGNKSDPALTVTLDLVDEGETCRILVGDQGPGFSPGTAQKPPADALGGRGVFLMKSFMKDVEFNQDSKCLEMTLPKKTEPLRK